MALVKAHRMHGHLAARLDPLGSEPVGDPALDPLRLEPKLTTELQRRVPASVLRIHVGGETLADALPRLRETYCGSIAYEIEHIGEHEQRVWLRQAIESWRFRQPLSADEQRRLYTRLCEVEGMERYLRRSFLGQKQFSLEGIDVTIPMLDEALELAADGGAREVVIGMAHRGRLNVLAHTIGMPYEKILREFEGERTLDVVAADAEGGTAEGRSTRHSSDLAKGFDVPIVHVNADDPEAAISAVRLALAYRARFGHDVVIDLVGYRRFGHNEQDEAAYTQPLMVEQIASHPTVRELYGARLVEQGVLAGDEAERIAAAAEELLRQAHDRLRASFGREIPAESREERVPRDAARAIDTRVPAEELRSLTAQLLRVPEGFTVHPKLK